MKRPSDFRRIFDLYQEITVGFAPIVGREISGQFDRVDNPPEISALFYKMVISEVARSATNVLKDSTSVRSNMRVVTQQK